uniref:FG-GAP repeat protein n=1 Tax=Aquiluna sp. TaxID=2053504 RepID=UPI0040484197
MATVSLISIPSSAPKASAEAFISQLGADIDGEAAGDAFGSAVELSSDGSRVAIGAYLNDGNGTNAGQVRIYDYNGSSWTQVGVDIDGEAAEDRFGFSVALSRDGSRVANGAVWNDGNGSNAGHVRIFSIVQAAAPSAPRAPVLPRLDNFNIETGENGQPQLRIEGKRLWCI